MPSGEEICQLAVGTVLCSVKTQVVVVPALKEFLRIWWGFDVPLISKS